MIYGFFDEVMHKYGTPTVWYECCNLFNLLPISVLINNEVLCLHGGLSPEI